MKLSDTKEPGPAFLDDVRVGLLFYFLTSVIAVLGVVVGHEFVRPAPGARTKPADVGNAFATWNGGWYAEILEYGYRYDPEQPSTVALFPWTKARRRGGQDL